MIDPAFRRARPFFLLAVVLLLLISALPALPYGTGSPSASSGAIASGPAAPPAAATTTGARPHPAVSCGGGYPAYGSLPGGIWPLSPDFYLQGPCAPIAQDEIHASFSAHGTGSGSRWTIPWYLPAESANGQENATAGVYLGMVVSGDPHSAYNQSYLELLATPTALTSGFSWNFSVAVLSFANASTYSTACGSGLNLSWNDSYWCEWDDLNSGSSISLVGVPGGSWVQATFVGSPDGHGTKIFVNQTEGGNASGNVTLNLATTGTYAFNPAYSAACPDSCDLAWAAAPSSSSGQPYGLGIGVNICPEGSAAYAYCDSYNGSRWATLAPMEFGIPDYWNGSAYSGTYAVFAPESTSGVCDSAPPLGLIVATCYEFNTAGGDGTYPFFTLAGNNSASFLTFGVAQPDTRTSWGGAYGQFLSSSGAQDLTPLVLTRTADSSDGGYTPAGSGFNVTTRATALGTVTATTVAYSVAGGAWTTESMTRTNGTAEDGAYSAAVPSGANGTIRYYVNATDAAGSTVSVGPRSVVRGPLPHFAVSLEIYPPGCGLISLNGTGYGNGSAAALEPGTYALSASGCANYTFVQWIASASLGVGASNRATTSLTVTANGSLTAVWRYVRPVDTVAIVVSPSGCGTVSVNGTNYTDGDSVGLPYNLPVRLAEIGTCAGDAFSGWSVAGNLSILGDTLVPGGNGSITATYVASSSAYAVEFLTSPSGCGGIVLGGAGYANGDSISLPAGTYSLAPEPCAHWGFSSFSTTGSVSVNGSSLVVTGSGTVTEVDYKLTEMFVVTTPGGCGGFTLNGTDYLNGSDVALVNDSIYSVSAYSCAGHYLESVTASGGLTLLGSLLIVNGTGTILVVSLAGAPQVYVGILTHPSTCGGVILGGTTLPNGGFTTESPGAVLSIQALPCADYGFLNYVVSGGIQIVGSTVWVNNSGAIQVDFGPLVPLLIYTTPAACGTVQLGGQNYSDGSEATLIAGDTYHLGAVACAHYALQAFESAPYVTIANGTITPTGPSTVTAVFAPVVYTVPLETAGAGCGEITINGAVEPAAAALRGSVARYVLGENPCPGSVFGGWNLTGNVSLVGSTLLVDGNGSVVAMFDPSPLTVAISGPGLAYRGDAVTFYAALPYVLATSGYAYLWSFGDGTTAFSNSSNATTHVYQRAGTYTVQLEVVDPLHRSANATWTVVVEGSSSTAGGGTAYGYAALAVGIGALAVVGALLATRRPRRKEPRDPSADQAAPSSGVPRLPPGAG